MLANPAFNLVITDGGAAPYGPNPRLQVRDLAGHGWALGLLLRPAAGRLLSPTVPADSVGKSLPVSDAPVAGVAAAVDDADHVAMLSRIVGGWLGPVAGRVDERGQLVNRVCRLAEEDDTSKTLPPTDPKPVKRAK